MSYQAELARLDHDEDSQRWCAEVTSADGSVIFRAYGISRRALRELLGRVLFEYPLSPFAGAYYLRVNVWRST